MSVDKQVKSVAIIGAGAAGAVTAAAFQAENYFEKIRIFERRESAGGTWIYDAGFGTSLPLHPGGLPPDTDPPLNIPDALPRVTPPDQRERYSYTPIYNSLTTNVPDIAMCFSDARFSYGPFAPHYIPRQYIENYFSSHKTDEILVLNTTVEDVSKLPPASQEGWERWKLTLRRYDPVRHVDVWWEEDFDGVVFANGHYSVPYVPQVSGLEAYIKKFPGRVVHSKTYRSPCSFAKKKVLLIGNSASGRDLSMELVQSTQLPLYQSIRSKSRWDGDEPLAGIKWKPIVKEYRLDGRIIFEDGTYLDGVDTVIYCTGYKPSFPFWNTKANGRPLWDYRLEKFARGYWHTFFQDFPSLGVVGLPRVLTFRSFEYQAIALARLFSGRNSIPLPPLEEQDRWDRERLERTRKERKKFHDVAWETGETWEWLGRLFEIAGLGTLKGEGRIPPVLGKELVWAIEHLRKYPDHEKGESWGREKDGNLKLDCGPEANEDGDWVLVEERKDLLAFI